MRADGLWLGIAGNQTVQAGRILRAPFNDDVDLIGTSDDWGASKPDGAFFEHLVEACPFPREEILYVGDRLEVDVRPAAAAGLHTALIHRGPWARIQWATPDARRLPRFRIESLRELPGLVRDCNASAR